MKNNTVGMILAAGFGTRLKELTHYRPKPLMELGGRAIIFHQIKMLERAGIKDIFINLHYQADQIIHEINKWPLEARIHFSYEEEILGTAGGIRRVLENFEIHNQGMLLLHGDMMCDIDLTSMLRPDTFCTLLIAQDRHLSGYSGTVAVDEKNSIVELGAFFSSSGPKRARGFFTGIHYLSSNALELLKSTSDSCLVSKIYPAWLKAGKVLMGDVRPLNYEDLGSPERLLKSNLALCDAPHSYRFVPLCDNFETMKNTILIATNVSIDPKARLVGPLILGSNSRIDAHAILGPRVVVGEHCHISGGAHVTESVLMSGTSIEKDERLDCVIALSKARVLVKDTKSH